MLLKRLRVVDWWLVGIVVLGLGLRLYRLPEMVGFDFDQEYAMNFTRNVWTVYPIRLIGQGLSVQGLFMGPGYFYWLVPWSGLSGLHPIGGFWGSIALSGVVMVSYYWIARKMWNRLAGLVAVVLKAVMFVEFQHDWSMVPSYQSELVVLWLWYWGWQMWHGKKVPWWLVGFALGGVTSFHPIQVPLVGFWFVLLVASLWRHGWNTKALGNVWWRMGELVAGIGFAVSPLVLFEYRRGWLMTKQLWGMLGLAGGGGQTERIGGEFLVKIVGERLVQSSGWWGLPMWLGLLVFGVGLLWYLRHWWDDYHWWLAVVVGCFFVYYYFLPVHVPEYYLHGVAVLVSLYLAGVVGSVGANLKVSWLVVMWLGWVSFVHLGLLRDAWGQAGYAHLAQKDAVVREIKKRAGDDEVYISYITQLGWKSGYRYLLNWYGVHQAKTAPGNRVFTIVSPLGMSPDSIDVSWGNVGLILPDGED